MSSNDELPPEEAPDAGGGGGSAARAIVEQLKQSQASAVTFDIHVMVLSLRLRSAADWHLIILH